VTSPSTHASLLQRLSEGEDDEAWSEFAERYGPLIRDYARRRGLQASDCDDLLQDVLLSLTKALPGFRYDPGRGRLRSYLKTVTIRSLNRKFGQERRPAHLEEVVEPAVPEDDPWEEAWRRHHLRRALARLSREFPERTRTAFRWVVLEGRPASEVAQTLGMSLDAVYQSKSRVLRRVSELVAEQVREEG